jgi:hypothetical protein
VNGCSARTRVTIAPGSIPPPVLVVDDAVGPAWGCW